jgi:DNA-binding transcriptional LysR family regulator
MGLAKCAQLLCVHDQMANWNDLKYLHVLHEAGSLAEASRRLGVNHATVSRRIAALEEALGITLVRRLTRETPLTPIGRQIAALASQMEDSHAEILRRARGAEDTIRGSIIISAPPVVASHMIVPHLGGLRSRHPALEITISADPQTASLSRGEADIAVRLMRPDSPGHIARRVGRLQYALYGTPDWRQRPSEAWCFITFDKRLAHVPQQRWLDSFINERPVSMRAGDYASQKSAACAGLGIALLPTVLGDRTGGLLRVHEDAPAPRDMWLVSHGDLRRSVAMQTVTRYLASILH